MSVPKLDSADNSKPQSTALYYLLKLEEKTKIGSNAAYFDKDDTGFIQSSVLLQDIDTREFKPAVSQPNTIWIAELNKLTSPIFRRIGAVTWAKGSTDAKTEQNCAEAFLTAMGPTGAGFVLVMRYWAEKTGAVLFKTQSKAGLISKLKRVQSGSESFIALAAGSPTNFVRLDEKTILSQINKLYGPTEDVQKDILYHKGITDFGTVADRIDVTLNTTAASLGPIFDTTILGDLKRITSMPHVMSGVIQNYELVTELQGKVDNLSSSFSGLPDTPSGYTGGMFIRVNPQATGLEFIDITGAISSEDIAWKAYGAVSELPTASSKHGMLAHVHGEGAVYLAHAGNWVKIYPGAGGGGGTDVNAITGVAHSQYGESLIKTTGDASTRLATLKGIEAGDGIYLTGYNNTLQVHAKVGFTGLYDTPSSYKDSLEDYQMVVVDAGGISYRNYATSFTGLQDTPNDLTNEEGKLLVVDNFQQIVTTGSLSGMVSFPELKDTPNNYEGGKYLAVDSNGTKIHYTGVVTNFTGLSDTPNTITDQYYLVGDGQSLKFTKNLTMAFTGLTDTPNTTTNGYYLVGTSNGLGFTTVAPGVGGTAANLIGLPDTPSSYAGEQGKILRVNTSQNGVEFFSLNYPTAITGLSDTPSQVINDNVLIGSGGQMVFTKYISGFTGLHDTPSGYSTFAENALRINAGESGIEYYVPSFSGLSDTPTSSQLTGSVGLYLRVGQEGQIKTEGVYFTGLSDVDPLDISANKFIQVSGDGSSLVFKDIHFTGLQGVPTDWSLTNTGKYLALNSAGNSITFVDAPGGGGGASTFLGLADVVPSSFDANKFVVVNSDGNGLTFNQPSFTGLKESPQSLEANRYLAIDSAGTGIVFTGAATAFTGLSDTPSSIGTSGQALVVNNQADGISYTGLVTSFTELSDTPDILDANKILVVSTDHKSLELKSLTFTGLSDTPSSVQTNKYLGANGGGQISWLDGTDAGGSAPTFSGLSDTPSDFHWDVVSGSIIRANQNGMVFSGLNFNELDGVDPAITGRVSQYLYIDQDGLVNSSDLMFTGLTDTPSAISGLKYLRGNSIGNALEFVDLPESSSVSGFTGLHDTPSSYDVGKFLKINAAGDAIEYGVPTFTGLFETPDTLIPNALLKVNPVGNGFVWATGASGANVVQSGLGSSHFTGLLDTPTNIAADEVLVGTKFNTLNFVRPDSLNLYFTGLSDAPNYLEEGKHLEVNKGSLIQVDPTDTFLKLKDTQTEFSSSDSFGRITVGPDSSLVTRHTIDLNFEYAAGEDSDIGELIEHAALSHHPWYTSKTSSARAAVSSIYNAYTKKGKATPDLETWDPSQYSNKALIDGDELKSRASAGTLKDVLQNSINGTIYLKFKNPIFLKSLQISIADVPGVSDNSSYSKNNAHFSLVDSLNNNALIYGRHTPPWKDIFISGPMGIGDPSWRRSSIEEYEGHPIMGNIHEGLTEKLNIYSPMWGWNVSCNPGADCTINQAMTDRWPTTAFGGWGNQNMNYNHKLVFGTSEVHFKNLFYGYNWNWGGYNRSDFTIYSNGIAQYLKPPVFGPRSTTYGPKLHNGLPDLSGSSVVEPLAINGIVLHPKSWIVGGVRKTFAIEDIKIVGSLSPITSAAPEERYIVSKVDRGLNHYYQSKNSASPTLYLKRGQSYRFNILRSVGKKFYVYENESRTKIWNHRSLTNNGIDSGSMVFDVPLDCPEVLYYGAEGTSTGTIIIPKGKPIVAGEGIQITEASNSLSISATGDSGTSDAVTGAKTLGTLGGGEVSLLGGISDSEVNFKKIVAGTNITLDSDSQSVVINSAGGGTSSAGITGASNLLGDGAFAILDKVSTNNPLGIIEAKSIKGGEGIRITESDDKKSAVILATGLNRFITDAENVGSKNTLLLPVTDQTIKVKTIEAGDNITISSPDSNTLKITSAAGGGGMTSADGDGDSLITISDNTKLRKLKAGSNISFNVENKLLTINAGGMATSPGSGGIGHTERVKTLSNFNGIIPDQLLVNMVGQYAPALGTFAFRGIYSKPNDSTVSYIQYRDEYDGINTITFNNDTNGTNPVITNNAYTFDSNTTSLLDAINNDHAVYLGGGASSSSSSSSNGGGGSSNFLGLTDTPSSFDAGKYLKVSNDGTKLEYKNITINDTNDLGDGGVGSHPGIQAGSNFYRNLPDEIFLQETDDSIFWTGIARLTYYKHDTIQYKTDDAYWINFSNNEEGTYYGAKNLNPSHWGYNLSLSGYVAKGKAIYLGETKKGFGQYSGIDKGDFEYRIPEYIYPHDGNGKVTTIMHFYHAADPGGFCYTARSNHEYCCFNRDSSGSYSSDDFSFGNDIAANKVSLSTYIDQGRVHYAGGGDIGSSAAGVSSFLKLTDTPSDFTASKYLKVNAGGNALEFTDIAGGGGGGTITGAATAEGSTKTLLSGIGNRKWDGTSDGGFIGLKGLSAGTNVELTELNNEIVITAAGSTETHITKNISLTGILAAQSVGTVSHGKSVYDVTENNIARFKRIKAKDSSIVLYDSDDGQSIEIQASPPPLDLSSFISGTKNLGLDSQGHKVHTEISDQIAKFKRIKAGPSATITSDADYLTIDVNACALAESIQSTAKPPEVVYYESSGILSGSSLSLVNLGYADDKTNPIGDNCEYLSLYIDGNRMSTSNMEGVNDWRPAGTSGVVFHMGIPSGSMISSSLVV